MCDYYRGGEISNGVSAWEGNWVRVLSQNEFFDSQVFHPDLESPADLDRAFLQTISSLEPDYVICIFSCAPGARISSISLPALNAAKQLTTSIWIALWGDLHIKRIALLALRLEYLFEHYWISGSSGGSSLFTKASPSRLPVVKRNDLFFMQTPWVEREYDVIFYGSAYGERKPFIEALVSSGLKVEIALGGERAKVHSDENYASAMRNAKICVSFARSAACHVTNARAFEALGCGTVLIEQAGVETLRYFDPGREFLMFWDRNHLVAEIRRVLGDETFGRVLAHRGFLAYHREIAGVTQLVDRLLSGRNRFSDVGFFPGFHRIALWIDRYGLIRGLGLMLSWLFNFLWWRVLAFRCWSSKK